MLAVVLALALAACYWWFHPAINLGSRQVWTWIIAVAAIVAGEPLGGLAALLAPPHAPAPPHGDPGERRRRLRAGRPSSASPSSRATPSATPPSSTTTEGTFAEDIEEVDYSEVPVIDRDSAIILGNRAMGSIPEYVSQFEIADTYSQINYQGRPVRVSPLAYADLFKWLSNRDTGIPAYVLVDMASQETQVVRLERPIMYSDSEPLARNVDRHVQLRYPTYLFDQKSFELDEDGNPWWVYPVQRRTIGLFDGTTIARVVLVDACTGETEDYAIEDCPRVGRPRLPRRPHHRAVQLERRLLRGLAQLLARPAGRGAHHPGDQRGARLQLPRAGRRTSTCTPA